MKVTINGKVTKEALTLILEEQQEKTKVIDDYCKKQKIGNFYYKDAELEYVYEKAAPTVIKKKEVETR
ncbi:MAG TPA: hypothetical protein PLE44_01220 [Bacilli bacterium]|nr:hypothetical protein [Bacilli bacterium]